jgi:hypothetical protein
VRADDFQQGLLQVSTECNAVRGCKAPRKCIAEVDPLKLTASCCIADQNGSGLRRLWFDSVPYPQLLQGADRVRADLQGCSYLAEISGLFEHQAVPP